jgi:hypothetical protein
MLVEQKNWHTRLKGLFTLVGGRAPAAQILSLNGSEPFLSNFSSVDSHLPTSGDDDVAHRDNSRPLLTSCIFCMLLETSGFGC